MAARDKNRCARCGKRIKKGGTFYRLKAELISSFDGHITVDQKQDIKDLIEKTKAELEGLSEEEIEAQVYKSFDYFVCPGCRDEIAGFLRIEGERWGWLSLSICI